ncbi:tyrosine-type recombinase/integrase [Virgibacillus halodenitrificans]|uniref:site-specific integrase n=1 Tax=Virgibacillus halodenitrificans TaxID=1482 RepID=UPI000760E80C
MARIYKKKTKKGTRWGFRAYMGTDPITGKDIRKAKEGFLTQKDAKLAAALFERQFHNGEYIQPSNITFGELYTDWKNHYHSQGAKDSSVRARKIALKHILNDFGNTPIQKITKKAYQDTIDKLANNFSTNYVSSIHTSASMVFQYAFQNKLIKVSPSEEIILPKKKETVEDLEKDNSITEKYLEIEELEDFLTITKDEGLESDLVVFAMLAYTGLRVGELVALKWSDIDFDNHTLRVIRTYYNPTNNKLKYQLLTPKTKTSRRIITIDELLITLLQQHKEEQNLIKRVNNPFYNDHDFIFATNEGYPKTIKAISIRLQRLLKKTTIKKVITPHSFRHTHTSLLIEAGVHIKEIQERLGHADIQTTMDIYAHMTKNIKKEASTKFSNLMKNTSKKLIN